jgi:branched-chain amino acid transport system substrate-binding protein
VECYESTKGEGALVYQPLSTGITYQLIPRATADGIPLHTMGYGRTSAANGDVFSHGSSTTRRTTGTRPR